MAQPPKQLNPKDKCIGKAHVHGDITCLSTWHCQGLYSMHSCGHPAIRLLSLAFGKLQLLLMLYVTNTLYILQLFYSPVNISVRFISLSQILYCGDIEFISVQIF